MRRRSPVIQQQLLQLARHQHQVRAQRVGQLARGVHFERASPLLCLGHQPAHRVTLLHAHQLHHAAPIAQRLADALVAVLVLHVHAAQVGGQMQMIGNENQQRLRIRRAPVGIERGKLIFLRAARVERFYIAQKQHLKGRHQRRRLRAIERLEDARLRQVDLCQREIAHGGPGSCIDQRIQNRAAAALVEVCFIAEQHISGPQRAAIARSLDLRDEAVRGGEAAQPARGQLYRPVAYVSHVVSEGLQHIAHQRLGKVSGEARHRRGIFLHKCAQVRGGFVLLMEGVPVMAIDHAAIAIGQRHARGQRDHVARGLPGSHVVGVRHNRLTEHCALQHRVRIPEHPRVAATRNFVRVFSSCTVASVSATSVCENCVRF